MRASRKRSKACASRRLTRRRIGSATPESGCSTNRAKRTGSTGTGAGRRSSGEKAAESEIGLRVVALIASYNERRFIEPCLEHLHEQGIDAYLIDNGSSDDTVERAERWLDRNLIGTESFPRGEGGVYDWRGLLRRKEELARELGADWFIHLDPDEVRLPPARGQTLAQALEAVDREGFNAVNFTEHTFIPTREEPDHDHPDFRRTLRTYYPFEPRFPHQVNAWKANPEVELAASGGHRASFPGLRMHPRSFPMKHYLFLSVPHAIE